MKEDKRLKRKVRNSYIVSTVSTALVLFLLGSVGYLMLAANRLADTLQRSIVVSVELRRDCQPEQRDAVAARLAEEPLVESVRYLSKEEKADDAEFRRMFGSSFEEILGDNPLLDSFEATLTAASEDCAGVDRFVADVERMEGVDNASYPQAVAERLHHTVGRIRLVLLLFGGALLVVSLLLLNNTVRLAIYSKRYLINTMKLVGATKWFIMRPFLASSVSQGILAGLLAALLFVPAVYGLGEAVPEITSLADLDGTALVLGATVATGVLLSMLFTALAVNKFVNIKSNKIHLY